MSEQRVDTSIFFRGLRPRSQHSVRMAMEAATTPGLEGFLIFKLFSPIDKPPEAFFTNTEFQLTSTIKLQ